MSDIAIGKIGKIISGDDFRKYIKIIDDFDNTGGFLILQSSNLEFSEGGDSWVKNLVMLEKYFEESNWEIEWQ